MAGGELESVVVEVKPRRTALSIFATIFKLVACVIPVIPLSLLVLLALSDSAKQQQRPLVYGALFAFLSQLSSIGKGLQKVGVKNLPELSLRRAVLWQYAQSVPWRTGFMLDVTGAIFGLGSLTILPISIAQPIFCNGLVLLALYSHFYLKEQLGRREWAAISCCFAGTVLLATTLVPRDWNQTDIRWIQVALDRTTRTHTPLTLAVTGPSVHLRIPSEGEARSRPLVRTADARAARARVTTRQGRQRRPIDDRAARRHAGAHLGAISARSRRDLGARSSCSRAGGALHRRGQRVACDWPAVDVALLDRQARARLQSVAPPRLLRRIRRPRRAPQREPSRLQ